MFLYRIKEYHKTDIIFSKNILSDIILEFDNIIHIVKTEINLNQIRNLWKEKGYIIFKFDYIENMQVYYVLLSNQYPKNNEIRELINGFDILDHHAEFYTKKCLFDIIKNLTDVETNYETNYETEIDDEKHDYITI